MFSEQMTTAEGHGFFLILLSEIFTLDKQNISFIHPFIHSSIHSFIHSLIHSFITSYNFHCLNPALYLSMVAPLSSRNLTTLSCPFAAARCRGVWSLRLPTFIRRVWRPSISFLTIGNQPLLRGTKTFIQSVSLFSREKKLPPPQIYRQYIVGQSHPMSYENNLQIKHSKVC